MNQTLKVISNIDRPMSASEISKKTGIQYNRVYRVLNDCHKKGMVKVLPKKSIDGIRRKIYF